MAIEIPLKEKYKVDKRGGGGATKTRTGSGKKKKTKLKQGWGPRRKAYNV